MASGFERTRHLLQRGVEAGLHLGAQVAVIHDGSLKLSWAVGENHPGEPLTADHLMPWLSSGKPLIAVAILQLWERGLLDLDAPVARLLPEFGQHGKHDLTPRHLLLHTGCFRDGDKVSEHLDWKGAVDRVCAATLDTEGIPGETAAYHTSGSWIVFGELIRRVDGRMPDTYVREAICEPGGLQDTWMAMPAEVLRREQHRIGLIHLTSTGSSEPHPYFNRERSWMQPRPGNSMRGPARDLARFYALLLTDGVTEKGRLLQPETVRQMVSRQRVGKFDLAFQHVIDWGWGVIINSGHYRRSIVPYGFGRYAGIGAFGHGGMQSSCGFADPEHGLAVAWICNGMPGEKLHQMRAHELNTAIYEDLGLAS